MVKRSKKIVLGAISLVIIGAGIFYACQKEKNNNPFIENKSLSFENPETYGILHNIVTEHIIIEDINLIYCDSLNDKTTIEDQHRAIDLGVKYCVDKNYIEVHKADPLLRDLYHFVDQYREKNFFVDLYESRDFFVKVLKDARFSENMINAQLFIRETVHPVTCSPERTEYAYNRILSAENPYRLNNEELFQIKILHAVTNHSREFWNGSLKKHKEKPRNPNLPSWVADCAEWGMYMDAVGSLYGLAFGPAGSIILGTTFSIGAKKACEYDGKYK